VSYETADWGHFEQIGSLPRYGPASGRGPRPALPGVGEHTVPVLRELGFDAGQIDALLGTKAVRQLQGLSQEPPEDLAGTGA
jgi:hypothetical protein